MADQPGPSTYIVWLKRMDDTCRQPVHDSIPYTSKHVTYGQILKKEERERSKREQSRRNPAKQVSFFRPRRHTVSRKGRCSLACEHTCPAWSPGCRQAMQCSIDLSLKSLCLRRDKKPYHAYTAPKLAATTTRISHPSLLVFFLTSHYDSISPP